MRLEDLPGVLLERLFELTGYWRVGDERCCINLVSKECSHVFHALHAMKPASRSVAAAVVLLRAKKYDVFKQILGMDSLDSLEHPDQFGETPLVLASRRGHIVVVLALLEAGANKEATNKYGETPLALASRKGYIFVVLALLEAGALEDDD